MSTTRTSSTPTSADRRLPPPTPVTFEEFHDWIDENTRAEWVDGEIILMSPSSLDHQRIVFFLAKLISQFLDTHPLGEMFVAPILMRLPNRPSGREPDLLFVTAEHTNRLRETFIDGPADLVVEIVSPDSEERDRVDKLAEYALAGIPEYWLVDLIRREAIFYCLGDDGRYRPGPIDADGFYHSIVLAGFRLRIDWLWQRPLPAIAEIAPLTEA